MPEFWFYVSTDRPEPIPRASASAERDARSASVERVDRGAVTVRAHAWSAREVSLFVSRAPALKRTGTAS